MKAYFKSGFHKDLGRKMKRRGFMDVHKMERRSREEKKSGKRNT